jgi:hypothetical protein
MLPQNVPKPEEITKTLRIACLKEEIRNRDLTNKNKTTDYFQ